MTWLSNAKVESLKALIVCHWRCIVRLKAQSPRITAAGWAFVLHYFVDWSPNDR